MLISAGMICFEPAALFELGARDFRNLAVAPFAFARDAIDEDIDVEAVIMELFAGQMCGGPLDGRKGGDSVFDEAADGGDDAA